MAQRDVLRRRIDERGIKPPKQPLAEADDRLAELFGEMLVEGRFSVTALVGFEEPYRTCALAWLHREKPYQLVGPRNVTVLLKNVAPAPLLVNHRAQEKRVFIQALGRQGSHTHTFQKEVPPGETIELESTWAVHAIWKHGGLFRPNLEAEFDPSLVAQAHLLEVSGELVLDGTRYRWPPPEPLEEAEPARARRKAGADRLAAEG
jgi:hypothetical protein